MQWVPMGMGADMCYIQPLISNDSQYSWADSIITWEAIRKQFKRAHNDGLNNGLLIVWGSERVVREIFTQRRELEVALMRSGEGETDREHPRQSIACVKTLREKEHGSFRDHGRLTHSKHGTAEMAGDWPYWHKWCTLWEPVLTRAIWRSLMAGKGLDEVGKREPWKQR